MKEFLPSIFLFLVGLLGMTLLWSNGLSEIIDQQPVGNNLYGEEFILKTQAIPVGSESDSCYIIQQADLQLLNDSMTIARK